VYNYQHYIRRIISCILLVVAT